MESILRTAVVHLGNFVARFSERRIWLDTRDIYKGLKLVADAIDRNSDVLRSVGVN